MRYAADSGAELYLAPYGIGYLDLEENHSEFGFVIRDSGVIDCTDDVVLETAESGVMLNGEFFLLTSDGQPDTQTMVIEIEKLTGDFKQFAASNLSKLCLASASSKIVASITGMQEMIRDAERNGVKVPAEAYAMLEEVIKGGRHLVNAG